MPKLFTESLAFIRARAAGIPLAPPVRKGDSVFARGRWWLASEHARSGPQSSQLRLSSIFDAIDEYGECATLRSREIGR